MRNLESNTARILAALALAALLALPAVAAEPGPPEVAALATTPGGISWEPLVGFDKLTLTVQGEGFNTTRQFTGQPFFAPVNAKGQQLPDGTYNWELTVMAPALDANNHHYRSDEPSADGRSLKRGTAPRGLVQSGSFTIANGAIVDPNQVEPASAEPAEPARAAAAADIDDSDAGNP